MNKSLELGNNEEIYAHMSIGPLGCVGALYFHRSDKLMTNICLPVMSVENTGGGQ